MSTDKIVIVGAKENNLKNIDLTIPRNKFIVFTGLSGSGKSSLAFDTIYAEGQRRYVESLSTYARMFLGQSNKPDVESIEGLSPSISIDQKTTNKNPRSTVGTVTEIYDYFRLLYARIGIAFCPKCGKKIESQTVDTMVKDIMKLPEGTKINLLAPITRGQKGTHKRLFEKLKKDGYVRVYVDGEIRTLDEDIELEKNKKHNIGVVTDRLKIRDKIKSRLTDSIEASLKLSDGIVICKTEEDEKMYSEKFACEDCSIAFDKIEPKTFSFNSPFGMCPECHGIGYHEQIDIDLLVPDKRLSIREGALHNFSGNDDGTYYSEIIKALAQKYDFSLDTPLNEASEEFLNALYFGDNSPVTINFNSHFGGYKSKDVIFEGIVNNLHRRYFETNSEYAHQKIGKFVSEIPCKKCKGNRLNDNALSIKVGGLNIIELTKLSVSECIKFFDELKLTENEESIANLILREIKTRLSFLNDVGLNYLTLARSAATLSGGESQRIRLATQIGSKLTGVLYVLDEPSIGLHQRDNDKLLATLRELTDIGNTVIVVEHDEETMLAADYIVDIGKGAGIHGGEVIAQGTPKQVMKNKNSITGDYLSGRKKINIPKERQKGNNKFIEVKGAAENNLKNINVKIELGKMTCVTGVSGSGKSTLVNQIIYRELKRKLNGSYDKPGKFKELKGYEHLDKIVDIDQSPIGRTPRSNPATYTGVFDMIRDVFASTNEAKMKGYKKGRFSFNVKGGRCEHCRGDGIIKIEMHFLPDVYIPCEQCGGKRYNEETLNVTYKGKNISEVLDMSVEEALTFFENIPSIKNKIQTLYDVGLGYIKLGQPSTQLSGGEAQRVKLATHLSKRQTGKTLYILDEPTTGLHTEDVRKLLEVLFKLREGGNSILIIEHNLDVIKCADYIIDLGPEGGDAGGEVIAEGTPEEVAEIEGSYTGKYLKKIFEKVQKS